MASESKTFGLFTGCAALALFSLCGVCGLGLFPSSKSKAEAEAELAKADKLYDQGKKAEAVAVYKDKFPYSQGKTTHIKRSVEFESGKGDKSEVRKWIEKGFDEKLDVKYDSPLAQQAYAAVKKERDDKEARKKAEEETRVAQRKSGEESRATTRTNAERIKANRNLTRAEFRRLVIGLTGDQLVEVIGRPDSTQDTEDGIILYYHNVAVDPATGEKSAVAEIIGNNSNMVKAVNFY